MPRCSTNPLENVDSHLSCAGDRYEPQKRFIYRRFLALSNSGVDRTCGWPVTEVFALSTPFDRIQTAYTETTEWQYVTSASDFRDMYNCEQPHPRTAHEYIRSFDSVFALPYLITLLFIFFLLFFCLFFAFFPFWSIDLQPLFVYATQDLEIFCFISRPRETRAKR